jgi:hypothetical protein
MLVQYEIKHLDIEYSHQNFIYNEEKSHKRKPFDASQGVVIV